MAFANMKKKGEGKRLVVPASAPEEAQMSKEEVEQANRFNSKMGAPFVCGVCGAKHQNKEGSDIINNCTRQIFKNMRMTPPAIFQDFTIPTHATAINAISVSFSPFPSVWSPPEIDYHFSSIESWHPALLFVGETNFKFELSDDSVKRDLIASAEVYPALKILALNNNVITQAVSRINDNIDKLNKKEMRIPADISTFYNQGNTKLLDKGEVGVTSSFSAQGGTKSYPIYQVAREYLTCFTSANGLFNLISDKEADDLYFYLQTNSPLIIFRFNLYTKYLPKILSVGGALVDKDDDDKYISPINNISEMLKLIPRNSWQKTGEWKY